MSRMLTSWQKSLIACLSILGGLSNCHQEPELPKTLIPFSCRVAQVEYIDTTSRAIYTYQYDQLGNRIMSSDHRGVRRYTFDANNDYVNSQQINGTTLTYQYEGTPKRISRIAGGAVSYEYTYEGSALKTYVAKEGNGTSTYTFTSGKLTAVTTTAGEVIEVKDGKISQRKRASGNTINYTYNQGQLTQTEELYPATGERTVTTYTYDGKNFYANTGLLFRGFPVLQGGANSGPKEQPGPGLDIIGDPSQSANYQTTTTKRYKKGTSGTETLVSDRTLTYRHAYNKANYSLGYARSDGARAKFYYTNCD